MVQLRHDVPWNLPDDWEIPEFSPGEIPDLAMDVGVQLIGSQVALVNGGINPAPVPEKIKAGVAVYRLGYLFKQHRSAIIRAIREASAMEGRGDDADA